ncbi:unnamed protein product [Dovyalis caffra]|uniref:Kinesin motor domain-containing protein n=1 Tax=Dovyalis caffra TaxID=77055 RepID=A0AAV1RUB5_9ROSI|nr:unnamed protein product [Dovyalis caffra]
MEDIRFQDFHQHPDTQFLNFPVSKVFEWEKDLNLDQESKDSGMDEEGDSLVDSMLCDTNSRLVPSGFATSNCEDEVLMFVNAGGEASIEAADSSSTVRIVGDCDFEGGNVLRTNEDITEAGDYPFIYQSARLGNFCYRFHNLPSGCYFVDLHFAEIINTNGPKGMRVLADFDIFAIVGANKPLQLVDSRVWVKEDGVLLIRFEGINSSAVVSGICIRKAPNVSDVVPQAGQEYLKCSKCDSEIEVTSAQKKLMRTKAIDKYENKILELSTTCQRKTNECHEAWMSLTTANENLEKARMELDNKTFHMRSLDQTVGKQAENLRNITTVYDRDKKYWAAAVKNLQEKIKMIKEDQSQLSREAHDCADSIPELNKMVVGVQALVAQCEDLKVKYTEEQAKRKELYNQIQDSKGKALCNIRVFCRCRPLSKEEIAAGCATIVDFDAGKDGDLEVLTGASARKTYKFDRVYSPRDNQVDVFADASPMVISVLDGYNVCIFAYGQTGTGKTFTMEGTEQNRGVNYRTLEKLFEIANERSETFTYSISVSALEVYNEHIRDLLATSPASKQLEIKQSSEGSHHVPGIVEAKVNNIKEVWNVLQVGSNARVVGSNNVNEHSSRSHWYQALVLFPDFSLIPKNLMNNECTKSKLWLVDLAGSERLAKTDVQGERLKEAQNINRSLSALGDVIYALATKSSHIPYSPSEKDLNETLSSLNFATRVRGIELGPARKQIDTGELQKMKMMLHKAKQESRSKDELLRKLEENLLNLENKAKGKDQVCKIQQEKIKELEGQLEMKTALHSQSEKQISQLTDRLKGREDICGGLQQKLVKVKELESKLIEQQQAELATFQQQVKELENKLKEQVQESESHHLFLQQKVKELERKLKQQEGNSEVLLLQQKIKELEGKLREQEKFKLHNDFADVVTATLDGQKTCSIDELMVDVVEPHILRSSNSINRPLSRGSSTLPRGGNSLHETRKKRQSRSGETENHMIPASFLSLHETRKKRQSRSGEAENHMIPASFKDNRGRKSDPPKMARVVRPAKSLVTGAQEQSTHKRINKDQEQGIKERDIKKKIWSR